MASNPNPNEGEPSDVEGSESDYHPHLDEMNSGSEYSDEYHYEDYEEEEEDDQDEEEEEEEEEDDEDDVEDDEDDEEEDDEDDQEEEEEVDGEGECCDLNVKIEEKESISCIWSSGLWNSDCPICFEPWTSDGPHSLCCTPCGHLYGRSCLDKWLQSRRKKTSECPQCKGKLKQHQIINIYAPLVKVPNGDPPKNGYLSPEMFTQLRAHVKQEMLAELMAHFKQEMREDLMAHVKQEMRSELMALVKQEMLTELMAQLKTMLPHLLTLIMNEHGTGLSMPDAINNSIAKLLIDAGATGGGGAGTGVARGGAGTGAVGGGAEGTGANGGQSLGMGYQE